MPAGDTHPCGSGIDPKSARGGKHLPVAVLLTDRLDPAARQREEAVLVGCDEPDRGREARLHPRHAHGRDLRARSDRDVGGDTAVRGGDCRLPGRVRDLRGAGRDQSDGPYRGRRAERDEPSHSVIMRARRLSPQACPPDKAIGAYRTNRSSMAAGFPDGRPSK